MNKMLTAFCCSLLITATGFAGDGLLYAGEEEGIHEEMIQEEEPAEMMTQEDVEEEADHLQQIEEEDDLGTGELEGDESIVPEEPGPSDPQ